MSSYEKSYRDEFIIPDNKSVGAINVAAEKQGEPYLAHIRLSRSRLRSTLDSACVYLCGDALGAFPKRSQVLIQEELEVWSKR